MPYLDLAAALDSLRALCLSITSQTPLPAAPGGERDLERGDPPDSSFFV